MTDFHQTISTNLDCSTRDSFSATCLHEIYTHDCLTNFLDTTPTQLDFLYPLYTRRSVITSIDSTRHSQTITHSHTRHLSNSQTPTRTLQNCPTREFLSIPLSNSMRSRINSQKHNRRSPDACMRFIPDRHQTGLILSQTQRDNCLIVHRQHKAHIDTFISAITHTLDQLDILSTDTRHLDSEPTCVRFFQLCSRVCSPFLSMRRHADYSELGALSHITSLIQSLFSGFLGKWQSFSNFFLTRSSMQLV